MKGILQTLFSEKKRVKELQKRIQAIGDERNHLRERIELLESKREDEKSSTASSERENTDLIQDKREVLEKNLSLQSQLKKMKEAVLEEKRRFREAQKKISEAQEKVGFLQKDLEEEKIAKKKALKYVRDNNALEEKSKKIKQAADFLKKKHEELQRLEKIVKGGEGKEGIEKMALLERALQERDRIIGKFRTKFSHLEKTIQGDEQVHTKLIKKRDELHKQVRVLKEENALTKKQKATAYEQMGETVKSLEVTKASLDGSLKKLEKYHFEYLSLKKKNNALKKQNTIKSNQIIDLKKELENTNEKLSEVQEQLDTVDQFLKKDGVDLVEQRQAFEALLAKKRRELEEKNLQLEKARSLNEKLSQFKIGADKHLSKVKNDLQLVKSDALQAYESLVEEKKLNKALKSRLKDVEKQSSQKWVREAERHKGISAVLQKRLQEKQEERDSLDIRCRDLWKTFQSVQNILQRMLKEFGESDGSLEFIDLKNLEELEERNFVKTLEELSEAVLKSYYAMEEQLGQFEKKLSLLVDTSHDDSIEGEIAQFRQKKLLLEDELSRSKSIIEKERKEIERLREDLSSSEEKKSLLEEKIEILTQTIDQGKEQFGKLQDLEVFQDDMLEKNHLLKKQLQAIEKEKKDLVRECAKNQHSLEEKDKELEELGKNKDDAWKKLEALQEEVVSKLAEKEELLEEEKEEKKALQVKYRELDLCFQKLKEEIQGSQKESSSQEEELLESKEKIRRLIEEKQTLEKDLSQRTGVINGLEKEINLVKETLVRGIREAKEVEENYYKTVEEKMLISNRYQGIAKKFKEQSGVLKELKEEYEKVLSEEKVSKEKIASLRKNLELSVKELQGVRDHTASLLAKVEESDKYKEEFEKKFACSNKEKEALNAAVKDLNNSLAQMPSLEQALASKEKEVEKLKKDYQKSFSEKEANLFKTQDENQVLLKREESLKEEVEVCKKDLKEMRESYEERIVKNQREYQNVFSQLEEHSKNVQIHLEKLETVENERDNLFEKYGFLEEEFKTTSERLDESLEARLAVEKKFEKVGEQHKKLQSVLREKSHHAEVLSHEKEDLKNVLEKLQKEMKEKNSQMKFLQQHFKRKMRENEVQKDLIEKEKEKNLGLSNKVGELQNIVNKLQDSMGLERKHQENLQLVAKKALEDAENKSREWEGKYFALNETWQSNQMRIKELERAQVDYDQMKGLLSSIRNFVGGTLQLPPALQGDSPSHFLQESVQSKGMYVEKKDGDSSMNRATEQGLFESTEGKGSMEHKKTLFD